MHWFYNDVFYFLFYLSTLFRLIRVLKLSLHALLSVSKLYLVSTLFNKIFDFPNSYLELKEKIHKNC